MRPPIFVNTINSQGRLSAYWSARIRQLVTAMQGQIETVYATWLAGQSAHVARAEGEPRTVDLMQQHKDCQAAKNRVSEIANEIKDQVAAELNGKHDGSALREAGA